eukprot:m.198528 g.198528  ORF g.198528 m.198528 type:complete len:595 (+) comp20470_c0_seq1:304-2088(+)
MTAAWEPGASGTTIPVTHPDGSNGDSSWHWPRKTRRFSHVVYEGFGRSVPVKALANWSKSSLVQIVVVVTCLVLLFGLNASSPRNVPSTATVAPLRRSQVFYNAGWNGGPIDLAGPDAKYLPRGQHVILDVYRAEPEWLNDVDGMLAAFRKLLTDAGLHILSSAGHQLAPQGVSITITIEESHLTIHTWPEHRAALVDLFTCGKTELLPLIPVLVSTMRTSMDAVQWSLHFRGESEETDLQDRVLKNRWQRKDMLHRTYTDLQRVDVWQASADYVVTPRRSVMVARPAVGDAVNAEAADVGAVRVGPGGGASDPVSLYSNGTLLASSADDHVLFETLVHPAMVLHASGAVRVAVVGGDLLAPVREVLRHKSVSRVDVFLWDAAMPRIVQDHMPGFDDCLFAAAGTSDAKAFNGSCRGDPRVVVHNQLPIQAWGSRSCGPDDPVYDVIIVALPHADAAKLVNAGHGGTYTCRLAPDGVVVARVGQEDGPVVGMGAHMGVVHNEEETSVRARTAAVVQGFGASESFVYRTHVPSFLKDEVFVVGCRTPAVCGQRWRRTASLVDQTLEARVVGGVPSLGIFNGAFMASLRDSGHNSR